MAESPQASAVGPVSVTIKIDGRPIRDDIGILSVRVQKSLNRIASAVLEIADGDMPKQDFPISNQDIFKPGNEIEIKAGYNSRESTIFKGLVTGHGIRIGGDNFSRLIVEARDKAVAMTLTRRSAIYIDKTDSDIIDQLLKSYAGLTRDVETTSKRQSELVQQHATDWDFMLTRAEANAQIVLVDDNRIAVKKASDSGEAQLEVTYGVDLIEFDATAMAQTQFSEVEAVSWNVADQALVRNSSSAGPLRALGNLSPSILASAIPNDGLRLQTIAQDDAAGLKSWAEGRQSLASLARIQGFVKFQGSGLAKIGGLIDLKGVGERFEGKGLMTSVEHQIDNGNWTTKAGLGYLPMIQAERHDITGPIAAGLVPGVGGLQIGIVKKLSDDPQRLYRIQVDLPLLEAGNEGVWARLASCYASNEFGAVFLPEIGDEVVLGFLDDNPAHPVILGSLYSPKNKPNVIFEDKNNIKSILTRSKLHIEFDEDKKKITIITPAGNQAVLDDDAASILLKDQTGNLVELSKSGIALSSPKDITIDAKGNVIIKAAMDVSVKGSNVSQEAQIGFSAKGSAKADVASGGQTTIKGAMIMIN